MIYNRPALFWMMVLRRAGNNTLPDPGLIDFHDAVWSLLDLSELNTRCNDYDILDLKDF